MDAAANPPVITRLEEALNRVVRYMASANLNSQAVAPGPQLSGSQRIVLRALVDNGPAQVSEVANYLGVTLSAATGLVDRLVRARLVTRDRDQKDRRVVWVKVTQEGEEAVKAAETRRRAALQSMVKKISEEELSTLCQILERIEIDRS